ncbi:uncharacterized protein TNCV_1503191 [Trichonephila clavipes]|uniref:Uncharacterized protein n=1 Tax=Trichonephila clavipes TaxID=2585209 RepID=A0A8X6RNG8_TRICX|nr:uncharacterized protein TNCV_1503191 [Trichonephila clavipes]
MTFLLRPRKGDLLEVARELGVEVNGDVTKVEIKDMILQHDTETIKAALSNATDTVSVSSADLEGRRVNRRVNLKDLVPKFDAKNADINLFFEIFERQGKKEKVSDDKWVSQLIPLLPVESTELIAKEPPERGDDYPHIKKLLLNRFQLTPVALRDRFESHQRRPGTYWSDLVFDLRPYLENWLARMEVKDLKELKELLVTEQFKKSALIEVVDHFINSWDNFKDATELAEKLDHFEAVKKVHRKQITMKLGEGKQFDKQPGVANKGQYYFRTILDRVLGARAAGVHYRLISVWTLVPVRLGKQLSDHSTVDEMASEAADCRHTYTMANCPQRR